MSHLRRQQPIDSDNAHHQDLLGHCLALYHESQGRIAQLEQRLRQYGYRRTYTGDIIEDPLEHLRSGPAAVEVCRRARRQLLLHAAWHGVV